MTISGCGMHPRMHRLCCATASQTNKNSPPWVYEMPVNTILGLFAKSPLKPMQQHMKKVHECSGELLPFFQAVLAQDWTQATERQQRIDHLEREADQLKRGIRLRLPHGLLMPLARTDLLELLTQQDKIANRAKDIAGLMLGRQLSFPHELGQDLLTYLERCQDATALATQAINELDDLLETGFRGREIELVEQMVQQLDEIEDDTDRLQVQLRQKLYALEANLNPVDVMFLYKVLENIGDLADQADRVGACLELMLARR